MLLYVYGEILALLNITVTLAHVMAMLTNVNISPYSYNNL